MKIPVLAIMVVAISSGLIAVGFDFDNTKRAREQNIRGMIESGNWKDMSDDDLEFSRGVDLRKESEIKKEQAEKMNDSLPPHMRMPTNEMKLASVNIDTSPVVTKGDTLRETNIDEFKKYRENRQNIVDTTNASN